MSTKKAKLNLDFGHGGVSMNFAMENEIQPRDGLESDWSVGTLSFNSEEFEDFPGNSHERVDENRIKAIADSIEKTISEWQKEHGFDFDSLMEVTISAHFYDVLFFPYSPEFSKFKDITESDIKKIDERRQSYKVSQIVGENLKSLTSPYYNILDEKSLTARVSNPLGKRAKSLGFDTYFITNHPMLLRLLEVMKEDGETIKVSLSCEREFRALANKKEKESKTALVHITDSLSEFSVWEKSELKYLNKKETGLRELREMLWRLCLCYHKNPKLAERDFELRQNAEQMQKFYDMVKKAEVSDDSKELLSADDCLDLLESASCILESESWENFEYDRLGLPGKSNAKNKMTISNYVLCYFVREVIRNLLLEIKKTMYNDDFCKPECMVLECPLPLKGIESLASEVFEIPVRRAYARWDGETRGDLSSSGIGALQSLISGEEDDKNAFEDRKKTAKLLWWRFLTRVSS